MHSCGRVELQRIDLAMAPRRTGDIPLPVWYQLNQARVFYSHLFGEARMISIPGNWQRPVRRNANSLLLTTGFWFLLGGDGSGQTDTFMSDEFIVLQLFDLAQSQAHFKRW